MKKLLTLFCSICATALFAQDYFYAYYSDGTVNQFTTTNIDSISLVGPDGVLSGEVYDGCGNKYNYVKIGKLFWMTKNLRCNISCLNYGVYEDIQGYPTVDKCYRDGGYLYSIPSTNRGPCPQGWRLPTKNELLELLELANRNNVSLLSTTGWNVESKDEYGFSLVPAGYYTTEYYSTTCSGAFIPSSDGYGLWVKNGGTDMYVDYRSYSVKIQNGNMVQYKSYKVDYAPIRCCRETNVSEDGRMKIKNN